MARSELEQLATAIHALADQIHRDIPHLHQRQHHISQLAARTTTLATRSNDPGLKRVADLTRIAAERVAESVATLIEVSDLGRHYADTMSRAPDSTAGSGGSAPNRGHSNPPPAREKSSAHEPDTSADHTSSRSTRNSANSRSDEIRKALLDFGSDVGKATHKIIEPIYESPDAPRGAEVNDPVTAIIIVTSLTWEAMIQVHRRRKGR